MSAWKSFSKAFFLLISLSGKYGGQKKKKKEKVSYVFEPHDFWYINRSLSQNAQKVQSHFLSQRPENDH